MTTSATAVTRRLIVDGLSAARPADAELSEGAADDRPRLEAKRVWIVVPLDGTREHAEAGRPDRAVWRAGSAEVS